MGPPPSEIIPRLARRLVKHPLCWLAYRPTNFSLPNAILLRKLRKMELHKRSWRYFVYAIGELVLIVWWDPPALAGADVE